jgi:predicted dienelactone hydrolase
MPLLSSRIIRHVTSTLQLVICVGCLALGGLDGSPTITLGFSTSHAKETSDSSTHNRYLQRGNHAFQSVNEEWSDPKRGRVVPVRYVYPSDVPEKMPIIIFSHGLGGNRTGGHYWSDHWASYGFLVIHIQHTGSDDEVWKNSNDRDTFWSNVKEATAYKNFISRIADVKFVLDLLRLRKLAGVDVFKTVDLDNIGLAGHSYGALTTLSLTGEQGTYADLRKLQKDNRIKAAIAFSPSSRKTEDTIARFENITIPFYSVTGTKDSVPITPDIRPENRRIPYDAMPNGDKYLLTLTDADHMLFSGTPRPRATDLMQLPGLKIDQSAQVNDERWRDLIKQSTTAFWLSYLKQDGSAQTWLKHQQGFTQTLGRYGKLESK